MKNLILILSAMSATSWAATDSVVVTPETGTPDASITVNAQRTTQNTVAGPTAAPKIKPSDFETFTPDLNHKVTKEDLDSMFNEMQTFNRISAEEFKKIIARVQYIQYSYEFSADPVRRTQEIRAYLALTYRAIQLDNSTESQQYFHNTYVIYKADFDKEMAKLSPAQRARLYAADDLAKKLLANPSQDNGE